MLYFNTNVGAYPRYGSLNRGVPSTSTVSLFSVAIGTPKRAKWTSLPTP